MANTLFRTGTNTTAAPGKHALCQGAGEENGQARDHTGCEAKGTSEEPYQQGLGQYVASELKNRKQYADNWQQFSSRSSSAGVSSSNS